MADVPPPPENAKRPKQADKLLAFLQDKDNLDRVERRTEDIAWYNGKDPTLHERVKVARHNFELIVRALLKKDDATAAQVYDIDKVVEYTDICLAATLKVAINRSGQKPRARILDLYQRDIYWALKQSVPDFATMEKKWRAEVGAYKETLAQENELSAGEGVSKDLTDTELGEIFKFVPGDASDVQSTKEAEASSSAV